MNRRELLTSIFAAPVVASVQSSWFALPGAWRHKYVDITRVSASVIDKYRQLREAWTGGIIINMQPYVDGTGYRMYTSEDSR